MKEIPKITEFLIETYIYFSNIWQSLLGPNYDKLLKRRDWIGNWTKEQIEIGSKQELDN